MAVCTTVGRVYSTAVSIAVCQWLCDDCCVSVAAVCGWLCADGLGCEHSGCVSTAACGPQGVGGDVLINAADRGFNDGCAHDGFVLD